VLKFGNGRLAIQCHVQHTQVADQFLI